MRYEVEIDWLGRRLAQLPKRTAGRIRWTRTGRERRRQRADGDRRGGWLDLLDASTWSDGPIGGVLLIVGLTVLAVGLLWQVGVVALVLAVLELAVLLPLILVVFAGRVLLRRPWRVAVRTSVGDVRVAADVRGYRAARQLRELWSAELAAGRPVDALELPMSVPGTLRPDLRDPEGFGEVRPDEFAG